MSNTSPSMGLIARLSTVTLIGSAARVGTAETGHAPLQMPGSFEWPILILFLILPAIIAWFVSRPLGSMPRRLLCAFFSLIFSWVGLFLVFLVVLLREKPRPHHDQ